MGRHNFEDELLIKRWRVGQKINAMGEKLKDKKKQSNRQSLFRLLLEAMSVFGVLECTKT
jgi:hypothetical protein